MVIKYPMLHDKEWLRAQLEDEDKSSRQIAKEIGCSQSTVVKAASRFDLVFGDHYNKRIPRNSGRPVLPPRDISFYNKRSVCYLKKARIMLEAGEVVDPHCDKEEGEE